LFAGSALLGGDPEIALVAHDLRGQARALQVVDIARGVS
jgi:hypothetical protein